MKSLDTKKIAAKNKRIDMDLLRSVRRARKKLRKSGLGNGASYNLLLPFSRTGTSTQGKKCMQDKPLPQLRTKR